ncbi:MAG: hypothetical protein JO219_00115 [Candidatus Eremiobacteraeota bacterium]|nr:hypothetical protein [Candidatus Eremiobacteraeota bacterium]MBV8365195.1 hypothetical protein [Candidatus Eremiobacteraeota bacterium]
MNACDRFRQILDDVAAGATADADLSAHLQTCDECAQELQRKRALMERIDGAVQRWIAQAPPSDIAERVMIRTRASAQARMPAALPLSAGIAAALALVVASYVGMRHAPVASTPQQRQSVLDWNSPTATLLAPSGSVFNVNAPGGLAGSSRVHVDVSNGDKHDE